MHSFPRVSCVCRCKRTVPESKNKRCNNTEQTSAVVKKTLPGDTRSHSCSYIKPGAAPTRHIMRRSAGHPRRQAPSAYSRRCGGASRTDWNSSTGRHSTRRRTRDRGGRGRPSSTSGWTQGWPRSENKGPASACSRSPGQKRTESPLRERSTFAQPPRWCEARPRRDRRRDGRFPCTRCRGTARRSCA